jgi:hypothetical protein
MPIQLSTSSEQKTEIGFQHDRCFIDILFKEEYLDDLYSQVYDSNIEAYLMKIDDLNTFVRH